LDIIKDSYILLLFKKSINLLTFLIYIKLNMRVISTEENKKRNSYVLGCTRRKRAWSAPVVCGSCRHINSWMSNEIEWIRTLTVNTRSLSLSSLLLQGNSVSLDALYTDLFVLISYFSIHLWSHPMTFHVSLPSLRQVAPLISSFSYFLFSDYVTVFCYEKRLNFFVVKLF